MGGGVVEPARSEAVLFAWLTIVTALVCTPEHMRPELSTPHLRDHRGRRFWLQKRAGEDHRAQRICASLAFIHSLASPASERETTPASERES